MGKTPLTTIFLLSAAILLLVDRSSAQPLRVGIAGLNHDHVYGLLSSYKKGKILIAGIAEPDPRLVERYKKAYQLPDSLFYTSVAAMLEHIKPDAVLAYNATVDHLAVVEACAPRGISVMVEKPLAVDSKQANRMAELARRYHIQLLTNYETTWYPTNQQIYAETRTPQAIGEIRKMIVHDGHQGPKEIGCSPDFLKWLTDPAKNGAGALYDFGCYGANLMTWLMNGQAPISVTAIVHHIKPDVYPKVEDDATILLEYPDATGIIEASWNWPFSIKDLEVFGRTGYFHALNSSVLQERLNDRYEEVTVKPAVYTENFPYIADLLRGVIHPDNDLSSLENNLIVVRILEAARKSAIEGKKILL
ncbi:MAG: Gfo/Idh/MocA family oxidoreductase [Puia sp.]|nr:Gfo/Idh/MocA family oxidoreductase [Puia sp.]